MSNKRFYWLKLKEGFFDEKYIKALRRLPQGDSLVIVYLKMQLKSLKTEGLINYEGILPDSVSELAMVIDENENIVKLAVEALIRFGAIERWENETLYMAAMQELIGSETAVSARVRKHRALQCNTKALQCNTDVTKCNTEIEIEKELDIELDLDIEKRGCGGKTQNLSLPKTEQKNVPLKNKGTNTRVKSIEKEKKSQVRKKYGEYENVLLSDTELEKLKKEFPNDYQDRIERLSEYIASTGKKYKNFLATIRVWARKDNTNFKSANIENNQPKKIRDGSEYAEWS